MAKKAGRFLDLLGYAVLILVVAYLVANVFMAVVLLVDKGVLVPLTLPVLFPSGLADRVRAALTFAPAAV